MAAPVVRTFEQECKFIRKVGPVTYEIDKGFVPNMKVGGTFYLNDDLYGLQMEELQHHVASRGVGGFLPAVKQIANVAALPGIVKASIGLPDMHSGYGFSIGNAAAFDMSDPEAIVSPGGVGFDINCGVRLVRTNLFESDLKGDIKERLTQSLFDHIPVGVGSKGIIPTHGADLEAALEMGMDWSLREGYAWVEDKEHCLDPATPVLLADGRRVAVGTCALGDRLVDEDGTARAITGLSTGHGQLYEVACYAGSSVVSSFVCNGGHQLVLYLASEALACGVGAAGQLRPLDADDAVSVLSLRRTLAPSKALGFLVPVQEVQTFPASPAGRAAAAAAVASAPATFMWQPTLRQYLAFAAAHPRRAAWCAMQRVTVDALPDARSSRSLSRLLGSDDEGAVAGVAHALGSRLAGVRGDDAAAPLSPAIEQVTTLPHAELKAALLADSLSVRVAALAGLIDAAGVRDGGGWRVGGVQGGQGSSDVSAEATALAAALAASAGFDALSNGDDASVYIVAPAGATDVLSPALQVRSKAVAADTPCAAAPRQLRGAAFYGFTVTPTTSGPFISLQIEGPSHRFLLADGLVVHNCEEYGRMLNADPSKVSKRAKKRGLPQLGTLGAGNHYAEVQIVDEIYDKAAASRMGIEEVGQVCVMIHSGSRGLGHQVATDALVEMERAMTRDGIATNDRQLACARIASREGQDYLAAMAAAANYAWVNRSSMTFLTRQAFAKVFDAAPDDLDMHVIYDVSHNIAKVEEHLVDGRPRKLLVHRKGATRAFGPHHPLIPVDYQFIGQPVLIGGTMGTCSYVLTGTEKGMIEAVGTTCHGAGRASSRAKSRRTLTYESVLASLEEKGISIRVASPKLVMEEAPESYKDVSAVVDTCHTAGISNKAIKLRPVAVVKG